MVRCGKHSVLVNTAVLVFAWLMLYVPSARWADGPCSL